MNATVNISGLENDTHCEDNCKQDSSIIFIVSLYVFGSLTVLFNLPSVLMVILTALRKMQMKYIHMLSLSITDALLGVSWILLTQTLGGTKMYFFDCYIRCYLLCITFMASMFQVFGICIERNIVICLRLKIMSQQRNFVSMSIIILSWGLAILISSIMSAVNVSRFHDARTCSLDSMFQEHKYNAFATFGLIFAITQVGVVVAMIILLVFLVQHHRTMVRLNVRKIKKSDIKMCITLSIVAFLFFAVNTPLTVVYLLDGFHTGVSSSRILRNVCFLFAGINSAINPFIYIFNIKQFRDFRPCTNRVHP